MPLKHHNLSKFRIIFQTIPKYMLKKQFTNLLMAKETSKICHSFLLNKSGNIQPSLLLLTRQCTLSNTDSAIPIQIL